MAFTADPATIDEGESSRLSWAVHEADTLIVQPGGVDVTAEPHLDVAPRVTTTYTLQASNDAGSDDRTTTVTVQPADPATSLSLSTTFVEFPGTSTFDVDVTSDGSWTAETEQSWLTVTPASGAGDATVEISVDRSGLDPGAYAGSILFRGVDPLEVATVAMRFPTVFGTVSDADGAIETTHVASERTIDVASLRPSVDYVPGELLVALDAPMAWATSGRTGRVDDAVLDVATIRSAALDLADAYGLTFDRVVAGASGLVMLRTGGTVAEAMQRLASDARVRRAEPNLVLEPYFVPNDPSYSDQWHYPAIGLEEAWDVTLGDADVVVAVIDTGFDL
ncbi:MAG: BACON domain-containing carbohydrate-binding protein, partial [Trueperaceae bacterium]